MRPVSLQEVARGKTALDAPRFTSLVFASLILLLLTAYGLRLHRLAEFPPGLSRDEATNVIDIANFARTGRLPLYQDVERPEPLNRVYGALGSILFGDSIFAYRYVAVLWGALSLAAVVWACRQCFAELPRATGSLISLVAVAALAGALGHIAISRSVYRAAPLVGFTALATGFTMRGLRRGAYRDCGLAGAFLALGCYTYSSALASPLAYIPLALHLAIFKRRQWRRQLPMLATIALVLFILTLPLSYLLLTEPGAVLARAADVSPGESADWGARLRTMAAQFLIAGDENPQYNIAEAPLVPPLFAPFFLLGLLTLLLRYRAPASALILGLFAASALPTLLTNEITHGLRVFGAYAPIALITGAAAIVPLRLLARLSQGRQWARLAGLATILALALFTGFISRRVYLRFWEDAEAQGRIWRAHGLELTHNEWFYRADRRQLAAWIAERDSPLLLPQSDLDDALFRALLMLDFPRVQPAADATVPMDARLVRPWSLEEGGFPAPSPRLALLDAGAIRLLPSLTEASMRALYADGDDLESLENPGSAIPLLAQTSGLPPGWKPVYRAPLARGDPLLRVNDELELVAVYGERDIGADRDHNFILDWRVRRPVSHDYGAFLQILTPDWQVVAGSDQHILRWLHPASAWRRGETVSQAFSLRLDSEPPPGAYRLVAGGWFTNGGKLRAESFAGEAVGNVGMLAWLKSPQNEPIIAPHDALPLNAVFADAFRLSYAAAREESDGLELTLYWTSLADYPPIDATIFLHALNADGAIAAQSDKRPQDGRYPTHIWEAGEKVATRHRLALDGLDGIELRVGMYTQPDLARLPATADGRRLDNDAASLGAASTLVADRRP